MHRPAILASTARHAIGRNLALDLVVACGIGVTMALVNAILPTVARRGGLIPIGLSALAAAPYIANLLGAFAGRWGARTISQLGLIRSLGAASLIVLFLVPPAPVVVAVAIVFWLSISFGGPFQLRLWGAMYPARLRGRIVGVIGMGRAAAGALAAFGGGLLADAIGGEQAVAVAGLIGVVCAVGYLGYRAAAAAAPPVFSARESIQALRERPVLARIAVAQGFYGGGLIAASPLYALVYVDRLNLSLADVGVIGILAAIANTVAFPVWGIVSDRLGALAALWMGSAIGVASVIAYAFAPNVLVLWIAALAAGTASGAIDVGIAAAVSDHTSMATRAAAMAGWNALTGARGIVAAFLMSLLLQVGLIDVRFGLLACAASSTIGVVMFVRASRAVSSGAAANRVRPDSSAPPIRPIATPGTPAMAATAATGTGAAPDAPVAVG